MCSWKEKIENEKRELGGGSKQQEYIEVVEVSKE